MLTFSFFFLENRLKTRSSNQRPQPFRIPCTELKHEVEIYTSREISSVIRYLSRRHPGTITLDCGPGHTLKCVWRLQETTRWGTVRLSPKVTPLGGFDLVSLTHHIHVHSSVLVGWCYVLLVNRNKSFTSFLKREFNIPTSVTLHGSE